MSRGYSGDQAAPTPPDSPDQVDVPAASGRSHLPLSQPLSAPEGSPAGMTGGRPGERPGDGEVDGLKMLLAEAVRERDELKETLRAITALMRVSHRNVLARKVLDMLGEQPEYSPLRMNYRIDWERVRDLIKEKREADNLTQEGLARLLGVAKSTFSRMYSGKGLAPDTLITVMKWLNVGIDDIAVKQENDLEHVGE